MFDPIGVACGMWEKVCMGQGILVMMARSNVAAVWVRQCKQRKGAYLNSILRRHEGNICEHSGEEARNGNLANSASEGKRHDMCGGDTYSYIPPQPASKVTGKKVSKQQVEATWLLTLHAYLAQGFQACGCCVTIWTRQWRVGVSRAQKTQG